MSNNHGFGVGIEEIPSGVGGGSFVLALMLRSRSKITSPSKSIVAELSMKLKQSTRVCKLWCNASERRVSTTTAFAR